MWKKIIFHFILIPSSVYCFSQNSSEYFIRKYAESKESPGHAFYILEINASTPPAIRNKLTLTAARKLSETLFIIETINLGNIALKRSFITKLIPCNNQWKLSPSVEKLVFSAPGSRTMHHFTILLKSNIFLHDLYTKLPA